MADVRDILGVPRGGASAEKPDAPAKPKERMQRPAGMSREAFALLGGSHPIVPSVLTEELRKKEDLKGLKQKRKSSAKGQVTWRWQPFSNPARTDDLRLEHWVKCYKDPAGKVRPADEGEYSFAKYNKKMMVYNYDEEEWTNVVPKDPEWSREETDYLISMCEQFDLRFIVITDRYEFSGGKPRSCEDLKARYYAIARALAVAREGSEENIANHTIVKHPFNAQHERDRKRAIEMLLARTALQDAEENKVLEAAAIIEAAQRQEAAARKAAAQPARPANVPAQAPAAPVPNLVVPPAVSEVPIVGTSSLFDVEVTPMWPAKPAVYVRGAHTREVGQAQFNRISGGARVQKMVEQTLTDVGIANSPEMPTRETCGAWLMLRMEVIALQEAKKRLQNRALGEAGNPEGRGKRAHKGKAPSRYEDAA
ncbi:g11627 [Coccomyxa elongata]